MPTGGDSRVASAAKMNAQIRAQAASAKGQMGMEAPGPSSNYSAEDVSDVKQALKDAQTHTPGRVLTDGPKPLNGVHFASEIAAKTEPTGVQGELFDVVSEYGTSGVTRTSPTDPLEVLVDDQEVIPPSVLIKNSEMASMSPYGTTMHELGHVWADQHGLTGGEGLPAAEALESYKIPPIEILGATKGMYGASDPQEGIAELYATKYTPGFSLPSETDAKFTKMLEEYDQHGPELSSTTNFHMILPTSKKWPAVLVAAEKNLAADAWVVRGLSRVDMSRKVR